MIFKDLRRRLDASKDALIELKSTEAAAKQEIDVTLEDAVVTAILLTALGTVLDALFKRAVAAAKERYIRLGVVVSWDIFDAAAAARAEKYKYDLIRDLTASTRDKLGRTISEWIRSDADFEELVKQVRRVVPPDPYPQLRDRARLIAQTETTRVYADSRMAGMQAAGLKRMEWRTAADELVCPICGSLANKTGTIAAGVLNPDTGVAHKPPAHPGCRCWLVEDAVEMMDQVSSYALPVVN